MAYIPDMDWAKRFPLISRLKLRILPDSQYPTLLCVDVEQALAKLFTSDQGGKMTIKQLAVKLSKAEGKKKEISVGDAREVLAILSDMIADDAIGMDVHVALLTNGIARKRKKKK